MKICLLGDTHFGMRNDSPAFHACYKKFYHEVFFPTLEKYGIKQIIQLGDLFDRRKYINFNSLAMARDYFFDELRNRYLELITLIGNHDIYYKNTLSINAPTLLLDDYVTRDGVTTVDIIDHPQTQKFGDISIDLIPWICEDNQEKVYDFIKHSKSKICCGHFQIIGFEQESGHACTEGIDRVLLKKYDMVFSGHFHHKSSDGRIFYTGSPGEITWADYEEQRGFHIFDTETRNLTFIQNPFRMHHKLIYNDLDPTKVQELISLTPRNFNNTYIKVYVEHRSNLKLFESFINALYAVKPLDITVIDLAKKEKNTAIQVDTTDTKDLINKSVDESDTQLDKDKLKKYLGALYFAALGASS